MPTKQEVEAGKQKISELMDKGMNFIPEGLLTELGDAFIDLTKALSEQEFNGAKVLEIMANINNGILDAKINAA